MYVNLHQTDNVLLCVSQGTVIPCIKGLLWVFVFSLGNSDLIFIFKSFSLVMFYSTIHTSQGTTYPVYRDCYGFCVLPIY